MRFAPSPTGHLHVGGARTALFNWLFARHNDGTFVLRIEDTDRERSRPELTEAIVQGLDWLGLTWDEGPHHQADFADRHRRDAERLLASGAAYRCFCTPEDLERRRSAASEDDGFMYDGRCRDLSSEETERRAASGEPHTVRFRIPAGETSWSDVVHGRTRFDNGDLEDFVLLRTDGTATYNFAVVSDDIAMEITHVIRGADHISNTPKQIQVYRALGHEPPAFCHVPLILGPDGKRLSKRHGATALDEYRRTGFLPGALMNFLALLGWSSGDDDEYFEVSELIERFDLDAVSKKSAVFDHEKLEWLNGEHLSRADGDQIAEWVEPFMTAEGIDWSEERAARPERCARVLDVVKVRARTLHDVAWQARPFFDVPIELDPHAVSKHWKDPEVVSRRLARLRDALSDLDDWEEGPLEERLRGLAKELEIGAGKLIHPLRVALTGMAVSPGIFEVLALLGRDLALDRIDRALDLLAEDGPEP